MSSSIERDVNADGVWSHRDQPENSQTLRLEGARIFLDRWQAGFSAPLITRERYGQKSSGLADLQLMLGYEALPDWDYNPYRPKAVIFTSVLVPTGKSTFEADDNYGLDSRGQGFWALGVGALLTKGFRKWDFNTSVEAHRSFSKRVSKNGFDGTLIPGWGGTATLGAGYNENNLRLGFSLASTYEDPIRAEGNLNSDGAIKRWTTTSLLVSYRLDEDWACTGAFSDQSWLGSPSNTSLSQSASVLLQKKWSR